jgi:hypothetical protein
MGRISRIEEKLASLVEKPFRVNNKLDPMHIEIVLKRLAEQKKKDILGKFIIPNSFSIVIDADIYDEHTPFLDSLRDSLKMSIGAWIREKGYEVVNEITFQFKKGSLDKTSFDVFAYYSNEKNRKNSSSSTPPPFNSSSPLQEKESEEGLSGVQKKPKGLIGELTDTRTGEVFDIFKEEIIIGRSLDCDVMIEDLTVSEIHAYVYSKQGKIILEDLGSKNGTRVNYEKVSNKVLTDEDRIIVGSTELIFRHKRYI